MKPYNRPLAGSRIDDQVRMLYGDQKNSFRSFSRNVDAAAFLITSYHLFSLAYHLMGQAERVMAWIDKTPIALEYSSMLQPQSCFSSRKSLILSVFDISHTPKILMNSKYYSDDDRVEIVGGERNNLYQPIYNEDYRSARIASL